jgi:hypothetical protein
MRGPSDAPSNGSKPDLSRSRFFCNNARKGSLVCGILAVRWVIVGSLVLGVILYVIGGRMLRSGPG